ncbi:hypothetical protein F8388_007213 [Cannabis sativa]|uniref:C2H2-type domain-containing protein n=1 Tax=Cannabis sativa TaxID=3483 RepID=A0A7J6FCH8_CANSA|nr:hypothetical protein F8388_007213 [Cannabis sativa]KAF4368318.1 hypothetical protein G4B88_008622 [Cannabis sativa]
MNSCLKCGKKFNSPKAVHGHMRTHKMTKKLLASNKASGSSMTVLSSMEKKIASYLILLSKGQPKNDNSKTVGASIFKCTSCHKVFSSYQALGGHRASHKSLRGCSAINDKCSPNTTIPAIESTAEEAQTTMFCKKRQLHENHESPSGDQPSCPKTRVEEVHGFRGIGIDLNKPPPMESDDDGGGFLINGTVSLS